MDDARVAMSATGKRLSVKLDAGDVSSRCHRHTSRRIHCDLIFVRTTVGDCSVRFHVTGHPGGTHVVRLRAKHRDDCPSRALAGR